VNYLLVHPKQNLVATAATGTGKTYTFFLPALYEKAGVTFIILPLKKLAHQHCDSAIKLGLTATSLEAKTISKDVINVHLNSSTLTNRLIPIQDITKSKYQYIILGPDLLLGNLLKSLWRNSKFVACINCIVVDEAHCVTQWLTFHSKY